MIDRYTINQHGAAVLDPNGAWVKYSTHKEIVDHWKEEASVAGGETIRQRAMRQLMKENDYGNSQ